LELTFKEANKNRLMHVRVFDNTDNAPLGSLGGGPLPKNADVAIVTAAGVFELEQQFVGHSFILQITTEAQDVKEVEWTETQLSLASVGEARGAPPPQSGV
jgi:hypothetical protein